jgi:hypothetical protein
MMNVSAWHKYYLIAIYNNSFNGSIEAKFVIAALLIILIQFYRVRMPLGSHIPTVSRRNRYNEIFLWMGKLSR